MILNKMAESSRHEVSGGVKVNLDYHDGLPGISLEDFRDKVVPRLLSSLVLHEIRKELAHAR